MIKTSQTAKLFIFIIPATKLLLLPALLTNFVGRNAWLFVLFAFLADIAILSLIIASYKKQEGRKLIEMFPQKWIGQIVCIILFGFLLLKAFYPILEHKLFLEDSLYENISKVAIFIPILVLIAYFAMKSLRIFGRIADLFFIPIVIALILLIGLSVFSGDFSELLPIAYNGITPFAKACCTLFFFGDFIIVYAFFGKINNDGKFSALIISAFIITAVCVLFFAIYTSIFGSVAYSRIFALAKVSKFNPLVSNLGRLDWLAILVLLCGIVTYSALFISAAATLLVQAFSPINKKVLVILICAVFFVLLYFAAAKTDMPTKLYSHILVFYMAFCQYLLPLIVFFLTKRKEPLPKQEVDLGNTPQGVAE